MSRIMPTHNMKNIDTNGTLSLVGGVICATRFINTITDNIKVRASAILSPDSSGRMNVSVVNDVITAIGSTKFHTWNNDRLAKYK